jgi:hypothetical protein
MESNLFSHPLFFFYPSRSVVTPKHYREEIKSKRFRTRFFAFIGALLYRALVKLIVSASIIVKIGKNRDRGEGKQFRFITFSIITALESYIIKYVAVAI